MPEQRANHIKSAGLKSRVAMAWLRDHQLPADPLCYTIAYEYLHTDDSELKAEVDKLDLSKDDYREQLDKVFNDQILAKRYQQLSMKTGHASDYVKELLSLLVGKFDQQENIDDEIEKIKALDGVGEQQNEEIEIASEQDDYLKTKENTSTDELTGVLDKNGLFKTLQAAIPHKENHPMTVVHVDIDKFGHFNDINGKVMGDAVLKHIAKVSRNFLKGSDIVSRLEEDKYILVLPKTGIDHGLKIADELRKKIAGISLKKKASLTAAKVTVSMGVSELTPGVAFSAVLEKAKMALNRSIDLGRNCVNKE